MIRVLQSQKWKTLKCLMVSCIWRATRFSFSSQIQSQQLKTALNALEECRDTYGTLFHTFAKSKSVDKGKALHAHLIKEGCRPDTYVHNHMLSMYSKCGDMVSACKLFDQMTGRNVISWTTMVSGLQQNDMREEAVYMCKRMHTSNTRLNEYTFGSVLAASGVFKEGIQFHALSIVMGYARHATIGNALLTFYARCGSVECARQVFDNMSPNRNLISYNAMIAGYSRNTDHRGRSFEVFKDIFSDSLVPDRATLASIAGCCLSVLQGKHVHCVSIKYGLDSEPILSSALANMYTKHGYFDDSLHLVDAAVPEHDLVLATSAIESYTKKGDVEGMKLFARLHHLGTKTDRGILSGSLKACGVLWMPFQGKLIHALVMKNGFVCDMVVGNSLVNMYAKCGSLEDAFGMFEFMARSQCDVATWNSMIKAYAQHGQCRKALELFSDMEEKGLRPDGFTFMGVLSACSHVGLVAKGLMHFEAMKGRYGVTPGPDHYACIVDLLGRAGRLVEAEELIVTMPVKPDAIVWGSLLNACAIHGNLDVGRRAAKALIELEPQHSAPYVQLANILALCGSFEEACNLRKLMGDRGVKKDPGCSSIQVDNKMYTFISGTIGVVLGLLSLVQLSL